MKTIRLHRWVLVLAAGTAASCTEVDTSSIGDYIGPIVRQHRTTPLTSRPARAAETMLATVSAPAAGTDTGTLSIGMADAVFMALENNRTLAVERLNPRITRTFEHEERAAFDPVFKGQLSWNRTQTGQATDESSSPSTGGVQQAGVDGETNPIREGAGAEVGLETFFPTGTTVGLGASTDIEQGGFGEADSLTSRAELTVTQALLRGMGLKVNLVQLRQARIDTLLSEYELRAMAMELVAQVEEAYWDCVLSERQIAIFQRSLELAEDQLNDARERVRVEKLAEVELAAAEAEVALRHEDLIDAKSALETARLTLSRLLNPGRGSLAQTRMDLVTPPGTPAPVPDEVGAHVDLAMRFRPELNQARLQIQRNELELVRTRNGLLPRMDAFITLGRTGYADTFGSSWRDTRGDNYDVLVGLSAEYPPINRAARAQHSRATLNRDQARLALDNLAQLAEVDVRGAYIELRRTEEQVRATAATRRAQTEVLRAETEKFRVGKSTSLLVAQAQRDLLSSEIGEIEAVISHLKAIIELYRLDGSLLERRGIACPGGEPVDSPTVPPST